MEGRDGVWEVEAFIITAFRGGLGWTLENVSSQKQLLGIGTGCPVKCLCHRPWKCLKDVWVRFLRTGFRDGLGIARLTVGFNYLEGLFQLKLFYDIRAMLGSFQNMICQMSTLNSHTVSPSPPFFFHV